MEKLESLLDLLIKYLEQGTTEPSLFREIFLSGDFFGALIGVLGAFGVAWFTIGREKKKNREKEIKDARHLFGLRYIPYQFKFPPRHEWSFGKDKEKDVWTWDRSPKEEFEKMLKEDGLYPYFIPTADFYATGEPKSYSAEKMTLKKIIEEGKPNNIAEHGVQIDGIECTAFLWAMILEGEGFVTNLEIEYYSIQGGRFNHEIGFVSAKQLLLIPLPLGCDDPDAGIGINLSYKTIENEKIVEALDFSQGIKSAASSWITVREKGKSKEEDWVSSLRRYIPPLQAAEINSFINQR